MDPSRPVVSFTGRCKKLTSTLLLRSRVVSEVSRRSEFGIRPPRLLTFSSSVVSISRSPSDSGIDPVKPGSGLLTIAESRLSERSSVRSLARLPISAGISPPRPTFWNLNTSSSVRSPNVAGSTPLSELLKKSLLSLVSSSVTRPLLTLTARHRAMLRSVLQFNPGVPTSASPLRTSRAASRMLQSLIRPSLGLLLTPVTATVVDVQGFGRLTVRP